MAEAITVRVDAGVKGDPAKPFKDMAKAAEDADRSLKHMQESARATDSMLKRMAASSSRGFGGASMSMGASGATVRMAEHQRAMSGGTPDWVRWRGPEQGSSAFGAAGQGINNAVAGVNQGLEIISKLGKVGNDAVAALDLFSGKLNEAAMSKGLLLGASVEGANSIEAGMANIAQNSFLNKLFPGMGNADALQAKSEQASKVPFIGGLLGMVGSTATRGMQRERSAGALALAGMEGIGQQRNNALLSYREQNARFADQSLFGGAEGGEARMIAAERARIAGRSPALERQLRDARTIKSHEASAFGKDGAEFLSAGRTANALGQQEQAQRRLVELATKERDLIRQGSKDRLDSMNQVLEKQKALVDQLKGERQGSAAEFGAMSPEEQARVRELAQTFKQKGKFEGEDLATARQIGIFGDVVRRQDIGAGEQAGIGEVLRLLGDNRLQQAEARKIELEQSIKVEIKVAEEALATQLKNQLEPAIHKLMMTVEQRLIAEMNRREMEQKHNKGGGA